jgi:uncharacterized protein YqgC (DUF456 family)
MTIALWTLAVVLIAIGVAGTVLPALPGIALVFGGILLGAWIDDFTRISLATVTILAVLAVIGFGIDYVAATLSARRAGASRLGLVGAALGTVAGIFTGLVGVLFMPLVGAAIGEFLEHRDALRAGTIGIKTWIGMMLGIVAKLAIVFTMLGVFLLALVL